MKIRKLSEPYTGRAEGLCAGLPYDTELAGSAGCSIVFWCGESFHDDKLQAAVKAACRERDIVYAIASLGQPDSFWAHQDIAA